MEKDLMKQADTVMFSNVFVIYCDQRVCVSVYLSVCLSVRSSMSKKLHEFFCIR